MSLILNVEILGEFKKLTQATQGAQNSLQGLSDKVGGIAKGIGRTIGTLGIALGFTSIVQGFKDSVAAAEEAKVANERIDAIALSMNEFGNQTRKVTDRIKKYAEEQALIVGIDDEVIKATQAKLLTFRELTKTADTMGSSFDRATIAAIDMAAAGFGEATSNATQLGKALNDPIKGITALNRAGIQFTEDQKGLIESLVLSGRTLEAQDIILTEIEAQVGGTAEATVSASDRMTIAFGEIKESIGQSLLPMLDNLSAWFVDVLPDIQNFFNLFSESLDNPQVRASVGRMSDSLGRLGTSIAALFGSTETDQAKGFVNFWTILSALITEVADLLNLVVASMAFITGNTKPLNEILAPYAQQGLEGLGYNFLPAVPENTGRSDQGRAPVVINNNVSVKTDATAPEIANAINKANKATGTSVIRGVGMIAR
jgi:hypothetical protein